MGTWTDLVRDKVDLVNCESIGGPIQGLGGPSQGLGKPKL